MLNNPIGPTNELAKERNRAAAERTMTTWIQNCLGLFGFGLALANQVGFIFIVLGIGLLVIAMVQHSLAVQSIKQEDYFFSPSRPLNIIATSAIIVFGLLGMLIIGLST